MRPEPDPDISGRSAGDPLTVIVCTRDRPQLLEACLESLTASLRPGDELIVVDSASVDTQTRDVALAHGTRYLRADRPGLSIARNVGWRESSNDLIAYIDDDVRVPPDWAAAMAMALGTDPAVAFVTGAVEAPPDQETDHPVCLTYEDEPRTIGADATGSWGHGANMGMRRSVLESVEGFDELLGAGGRFRAGEEYDFFDRVLAKGFNGRFDPAVRASHEQWRPRRVLIRLDHSYGQGAGARVSKLLRASDRASRRRGLVESWLYLWRGGARAAARCLLRGHEFGVLYAIASATGFLRGLVLGLLVPVRDGHFAGHGGSSHR